MTSLAHLKKQADDSCHWRGHVMLWNPAEFSGKKITQSAECKHCGRWVTVNTKPAPNEIDIGGSAVAVGCIDDGSH